MFLTPSVPNWIPQEAIDLQILLFFIAHTNAGGHRGRSATMSTLASLSRWDTLEADMKVFVSSCLYCLSTTRVEEIPRAIRRALFGAKLRDTTKFDCFSLIKSTTADRYMLIMRDDHNCYEWLHPELFSVAEEAASTLTDWCTAFRPPKAIRVWQVQAFSK